VNRLSLGPKVPIPVPTRTATIAKYHPPGLSSDSLANSLDGMLGGYADLAGVQDLARALGLPETIQLPWANPPRSPRRWLISLVSELPNTV
jgi:hypothetical protein